MSAEPVLPVAATHLILVRHAQSLYNRDGEKAGLNSGLTELGWRQAQAVAEWLARTYKPDAIVSSSLVRARQTAEIIAQRLGLPPIVHEGIEEAEFSYWDELPRAPGEPLITWYNSWQPDPVNAPLYTSFRARIYKSLQRLLTAYAGKTVILVSHGGTIGTLLRSLFGGHHVAVFTENTGVTHLTWDRDHWRLVYHNSTAHLAGLMPLPVISTEEPVQTYASPWADGRQIAAVIEQFRRVAAATSGPAGRLLHPNEAEVLALIELAAPRPEDRVLDVATGRGIIALAFAPYVAGVLGIDVSPAMLEHADAARAAGNLENVHFRLGEIGALPLAPASFEIIICHDLLHYVTDVPALLARFRSLLAAGGRLVLDELVGSDDPVKRATQNAIEQRRNPAFTQVLAAQDILQALAAGGFVVRRSERYAVQRELGEWLAEAAADNATRSTVRGMLEAGMETDSAGLSPRRTRDNQIVFVQTRLRCLATPQPTEQER
ncbi:MAG: histidine phosphatase family protein [Anaerolineae bacterium]